MFDLSKCRNFITFKQNHVFEKYLIELPKDLRIAYSKVRCLIKSCQLKKKTDLQALQEMIEFVICAIVQNLVMSITIVLNVSFFNLKGKKYSCCIL